MAINTVRRLAADIMSVGENRVRISPDGIKDAESAMTRDDVRELIAKGIVTRVPVGGRKTLERRKRRGPGGRKGCAGRDSKAEWMSKVRSQRRLLKAMVSEGALKRENKREIYLKIKSGLFRSVRALVTYLRENGMVGKDYEPKRREFVKKAVKPQKAARKKAAGKPGGKKGKEAAAAKHEAPKPSAHAHVAVGHKGEAQRPHEGAAHGQAKAQDTRHETAKGERK